MGELTTQWVSDGNVVLHEWSESSQGVAPTEDVVALTGDVSTWVFNPGTLEPMEMVKEELGYSIITDYLGTPNAMFDAAGEEGWSAELDSFGAVRNETGISGAAPFRYQGQYYDDETGLAYNRFRYYSPDTGSYISQDPIRLAGNNLMNIETAKKLAEHFAINEVDFYSPEQIETYSKAAFYLFIHGEDLSSMLKQFNHLQFKDYTTWAWIEPLILLKSRVFKSNIRDYKQDVLDVLTIGNDLQKQVKKRTFSRLLKGETLYEEQIAEARNSDDQLSEESFLLSSIMKLVVISEMGGSDDFSVEKCELLMHQYMVDFVKLTG